jgi:hypothetical protein
MPARSPAVGKPPLPPLHPWYVRAAWDTWTWITWPLQARTLRRHGFRKTGFMTYMLGPEDDDDG